MGYQSMPETLPDIAPMSTRDQSILIDMMQLRKQLIAMGASEVVTYSFISEAAAKLSHQEINLLPAIANPRSPEQKYLRSSILPSHLELWQKNTAYRMSPIVFEVSRVFRGRGASGDLPEEKWQLALSTVGENSIHSLQAFMHKFLSQIKASTRIENHCRDTRFVKQRSARIISHDGQQIGCFGQIAAPITHDANIVHSMSYAEIDIIALLENTQPVNPVRPVPDYQLVVRDITLELFDTVAWQRLHDEMIQFDELVSFEYTDVFQDEQLASQSRRAITVRLRLDGGAQPDGGAMQKLIEMYIAKLNKKLPTAHIVMR